MNEKAKNKKIYYIGIGILAVLFVVGLITVLSSTSSVHKDLLVSAIWKSDTTNAELEFFESGVGTYHDGSGSYTFRWMEVKDENGEYSIEITVVGQQAMYATSYSYDLRFENEKPMLIGCGIGMVSDDCFVRS